ncbi:MAG TPA: lamin tail domain-containing protein, partial [Candidatus Binatia bacterium]|nr:lamin tail domain-containing protein [Candidatus Binatia bacterium]
MADNRSTTNVAGAYPDWVELYNARLAPLSLTGWSLSDNDDPRRFVFTGGPLLAPGAYLVVFCDTNAAPGIHTGFGLDKEGSHVLLYDPNTNRIDAVSFGAQLPDYSIGRIAGGWVLNSPTPGGPNVPTATGPATDLVINEWLANAVPGGTDWVELFNRSATRPIALNGIYLDAGGAVFRYTTLAFVAPGGFLQLLADEAPGPAHLDFKLSAAGSSIALYDEAGLEVNRVTFGLQVEGISQGRLPDGGATIVSFPGSASPGAANYVITYGGPVLNEVLARNQGGSVTPWGARADWVELANTNGTAVALGGFGLSDEPGTRKWSFPSGTAIPANGYLRVWCDGDAPPSEAVGTDLNAGFSLGSKSGGVYLFGTNGLVVDYVEYGFQVADLSIGRSGGAWRLLATPSPGALNSLPASLGNASGLRFNEWLSDPASGHDWFELYNLGTAPVELSGLYLTDDPALTGLDQFRVAPLSFLGGLGFAQFEADGDPSQGHHHVNFRLDSGGDALRLYDASFGPIDAVDFGALALGVSMGRLPDGSGSLATFPGNPTPGQSNYRR